MAAIRAKLFHAATPKVDNKFNTKVLVRAWGFEVIVISVLRLDHGLNLA